MNTVKSILLCMPFIVAGHIAATESKEKKILPLKPNPDLIETRKLTGNAGYMWNADSCDFQYTFPATTANLKYSTNQSADASNKTYTLQEAQEELEKNPYALHDACRSYKGGSYQKVEMLIEAGANVNAIDEHEDWTPLHSAVCGQNSEIVTLLIKSRANVMAKTPDGNTPLHFASSQGTPKNIEILLKADADINCQNDFPFFYTPLMKAAARDFEQENAIKLVELGADINCQGLGNQTALHLAARQKHSQLTQLLLEKSADPFKQDKKGWTSLHFATGYNYSKKSRSICAIILGNLGFFNKDNSCKPNGKYSLQELVVAKILDNADDFIEIIESNGYELADVQNMIVNLTVENQPKRLDKKFNNRLIYSIRKQLIGPYYQKKCLNLMQELISIKNNEGKIAVEIADKGEDQQTIALLTQAEEAQSYSDLPEEIKTIAEKNIAQHVEY